ncbi:hypothetical protein PIB30_057513 [Stylosanthes scabra]|uniref:F-box associated domain-containing protein n=1 Tax=Stylosanthes scabra TaxID=79078 RepID=A0ABU6QLG8_9FABA|nr:hypothetical protein [Stylosanthes scabra]
MSDHIRKHYCPPYLGDDILFQIFVKCHPKTVGRLRALSKYWSIKLNGVEFAKQNWLERNERDQSLLICYGYTSYNDRAHWFVRVRAETGEEIPMDLPFELVDYGYFSMIGSDMDNLCIRFSGNGHDHKIIVWNPITKDMVELQDQAHEYWGFTVSTYAFGFLPDCISYRVVYFFKKDYDDRELQWVLWNSDDRRWNQYGMFVSDISKIGPTFVLDNSVAYFIGWGGLFNIHPSHIIGFCLQDGDMFQDEIPKDKVRRFNSITKFNHGLGYVAYEDIDFSKEVTVWSLTRTNEKKFTWEKMINISDFAIPYTPTILHGSNILSILDTRSTTTGANDD